jgi:hypothetical protein
MRIQAIFSLSTDVHRLSLALRRASSVFIRAGESVRRFAVDMRPAGAPDTHRAALLALALERSPAGEPSVVVLYGPGGGCYLGAYLAVRGGTGENHLPNWTLSIVFLRYGSQGIFIITRLISPVY